MLRRRRLRQFDSLADRLDQLCEMMVPKVVGQVLDPIIESRIEQPQEPLSGICQASCQCQAVSKLWL